MADTEFLSSFCTYFGLYRKASLANTASRCLLCLETSMDLEQGLGQHQEMEGETGTHFKDSIFL